MACEGDVVNGWERERADAYSRARALGRGLAALFCLASFVALAVVLCA